MRFWPCKPCCGGTPNCCDDNGGAVPTFLTLAMSGLSGTNNYGFPTCTVNCADLNGTWVVPQDITVGGGDCGWYEEWPMTCQNTGDPWTLIIRIRYDATAADELYVEFMWNAISFIVVCFKATLSKPCSSWSSTAVGTDCGSGCTGGTLVVSA